MRKLLITITAAAGALLAARPAAAGTVGAIAEIKGVREHQVIGIGLVVGLNGTGDKTRETKKSIALMLKRLKFNPDPADMASKNIALVFVTAKIKSGTSKGTAIDVNVASMGDATSLDKGTLLATPLHTNEPEVVYARAQGNITIGTSGHPTAATIKSGATLEKEIPSKALDKQHINEKGEKVYYFDLVLSPDKADFRLTSEIAANINTSLRRTEDNPAAKAMSTTQVRVEIPRQYEKNRAAFVSNEIMNVPVTVDPPAKVIIKEREGVMVATSNVLIDPARIMAAGQNTTIDKGGTWEDLQTAFKKMALTGADQIVVVKALADAGALQAKLVIK